MIRKALLAFRRRDIPASFLWLLSGVLHIGLGMFLSAVLLSSADASPLAGASWDTDWSKILTLLVGLVGVYVALERRLTALETAGTAQNNERATELKLWVQGELREMRDTIIGHTHRIDAVERQRDRA
jgi:hypothetical protein